MFCESSGMQGLRSGPPLHTGLLATLPWPMVSDEYKRKRMEINLLGLGAYRDQMLSEPFF